MRDERSLLSQGRRPPLTARRPSLFTTGRELRLDVVAQPLEGGRNQVRVRADVDHGFDAGRQGFVDRVPQSLRMVDPRASARGCCSRCSSPCRSPARRPAAAARQAAGHRVHHAAPRVGNRRCQSDRRVQRRPAVVVLSQERLWAGRPRIRCEAVDRVPLAQQQHGVRRRYGEMAITPWPSRLIPRQSRLTASKSSSGPREKSTPIVTSRASSTLRRPSATAAAGRPAGVDAAADQRAPISPRL